MKIAKRIILAVGFVVLIIVSWVAAFTVKTAAEDELTIQAGLTGKAKRYLEDEIYILAIPVLEEAISYQTENTPKIEEDLKKLYLKLINQKDFRKKYTALLENQMNREGAEKEIFMEAALFYNSNAKLKEACDILRTGIEKTKSEELFGLYESIRYAYKTGYYTYEDVTDNYKGTIGVKNEGFWGLADYSGSLLLRCQYEKISTFYSGRAIVLKEGIICAVDESGNRVALLKAREGEKFYDFNNLSEGFAAVLTDAGWKRLNMDLETGNMVFEEINTYSNGCAAAKQDGKWGVIDTSANWFIPAEYDGVITDELGRAYMQDSVFIKKDGAVYLFSENKITENVYEDAKPFGSGEYAAVKKDGKWGFIDISGELKIPCQFEDALSFGQNLAAVKKDGFWGYISIYGNIAIEPVFLQAKTFDNYSAPVLTENGWRFISLTVKN